MCQHPAIGAQIIASISSLSHLAGAVRAEHERYDGHGYPDGLTAHQIPLQSRIVFACDAYHAMVSDRPYRHALSASDAIAELQANAGTQFDPDVVAALLRVLGRLQPGAHPPRRYPRPLTARPNQHISTASRPIVLQLWGLLSPGAVRCYTCRVPTSHPRHSITETPALAAALEPLRARLGAEAPTLAELVLRGAESRLRELEAQDHASARALETFVDRLCAGSPPDLDEIQRIRHAGRHP